MLAEKLLQALKHKGFAAILPLVTFLLPNRLKLLTTGRQYAKIAIMNGIGICLFRLDGASEGATPEGEQTRQCRFFTDPDFSGAASQNSSELFWSGESLHYVSAVET